MSTSGHIRTKSAPGGLLPKKNDDLEAENHMEMKSSKKEGTVEKCVFLKDPV